MMDAGFPARRTGLWAAIMIESYCREKLGPLVLRLALGLVCVYHGYLKIMAAGGTAWAPGLSVWLQVFLAWGQFTGGVAVLFGFRTRLAAGLVLACMAGQTAYYHGWDLLRLPLPSLEPLLIMALVALGVLFVGAGDLAVDGRGGARGFRKRAA
jgi:putative oxidoreductase